MTADDKTNSSKKVINNVLEHLTKILTMEGLYFTQCTFNKPWAIDLPKIDNCVIFHMVVGGAAKFIVEKENIIVKSQELIIFPNSIPHLINDGSSSDFYKLSDLPIKPVTSRFETLSFGGEGQETKLICGALVFNSPVTKKLIDLLPRYMTITSQESTNMSSIKSLFSLINSEVQNITVGSDATLSKLAELLIISSIREYFSSPVSCRDNILLMLSDTRILRSLELMHKTPEFNWSLEKLAKEVGMSRTSFVEKFRNLVGSTPIEYLTDWRMSLAHSRLQNTSESLLSIALEIGYKSEASFSRTFKKVMGKNPGDVRREIITNGTNFFN